MQNIPSSVMSRDSAYGYKCALCFLLPDTAWNKSSTIELISRDVHYMLIPWVSSCAYSCMWFLLLMMMISWFIGHFICEIKYNSWTPFTQLSGANPRCILPSTCSTACWVFLQTPSCFKPLDLRLLIAYLDADSKWNPVRTNCSNWVLDILSLVWWLQEEPTHF